MSFLTSSPLETYYNCAMTGHRSKVDHLFLLVTAMIIPSAPQSLLATTPRCKTPPRSLPSDPQEDPPTALHFPSRRRRLPHQVGNGFRPVPPPTGPRRRVGVCPSLFPLRRLFYTPVPIRVFWQSHDAFLCPPRRFIIGSLYPSLTAM